MSTLRSTSKIQAYLPQLLVLSGLVAFFGYYSTERLIARDEGFYIIAAQLVAQGKTLYLDFFYPQMPLLPYLYGKWMQIVGFSWENARLLSAVFTAMLGALIFSAIRKKTNTLWGLFGLYFFCLSTLVFPWYITVKTYAFSNLCLFAAYMLVDREARTHVGKALFLAGALLGAAVDARLFFVALTPVLMALILFRNWKTAERWSSQLYFLFGFGIAVSPNLYFMLNDFSTYWFNNMGYHMERSDQTFAASLRSKQTILRVLTGFKESRKFVAYQFPILLYMNILYALYCVYKRKLPDGALLIAIGLFVVNFLPTPSYVQYFSTLVPFLAVGLVLFLAEVAPLAFTRSKVLGAFGVLSFAPLAIYYGAYTHIDMDRYARTGEGVIGIRNREMAKDWRLETVNEVAKKIDAITQPGEIILSQWPGYLLETHAQVHPGTEDHFGIRAAAKLTEDEKQRYKVISSADIKELLARRSVRIFVATKRTVNNSYRKALAEGGYKVVDRVHDVLIYSNDLS